MLADEQSIIRKDPLRFGLVYAIARILLRDGTDKHPDRRVRIAERAAYEVAGNASRAGPCSPVITGPSAAVATNVNAGIYCESLACANRQLPVSIGWHASLVARCLDRYGLKSFDRVRLD